MIAGLLWRAGPWLALAVAGLVIWGLWASLGTAKLRLANAEAVIAQRDIDMKLSSSIVAKQADALARLETKVVTVVEKIYAAPITRECVSSPSMRAATVGVRDIIGNPGGPPAGRQPAPAVR